MAGRYTEYPEYKSTDEVWLGNIPANWKVVQIKYIADSVNTGGTPKELSSFTEEPEVFWFSPSDFHNGHSLEKANKYVTWRSVNSKDSKIYRANSVLVIGIGATLGKVAHCSKAFSCNQQINVISPNSNVNSFFLMYSLSVQSEQIIQSSNASTIGIMNQEKTKDIAIALPTNKEQQKIASFLDHETAKIDTLIAKQEKLIELLKEKRQAVISHAVTKGLNPNAPMRDSGVEWLGEVPEHWSVKKLSSSSKITRLAGYEYTAYWKATESGEIIAIRGQNIRFNKLIELNKAERISSSLSERLWRSKLSRNDIAYPCVGTIGNAVLIEEDDKYHINQNIAKLTPTDRVHPLFLTYFLNSKVCLESALFLNTSDAQPSVLVGNLRRVKIAIPQREEQILISKYLQQQLKKLEDINDKTLLTINLMKERKTALISAAVTGKIDVRDFVSEQGQPQGV